MQVKTHSKENAIPHVSTFNPNNAEMFGIFTNNLHILYSGDKNERRVKWNQINEK